MKCRQLVSPKNCQFVSNESLAEYKCDPGYDLFYGSSIRYCNSTTSEWSGLEPVCEKVFRCPNGYFNYGTKCLRFFELNPAVKMTYQNASRFCSLNSLDLFTAFSMVDLKYEAARYGPSQLVFASAFQADETLKCLNTSSSDAETIECQKPFILVCSKNRG